MAKNLTECGDTEFTSSAPEVGQICTKHNHFSASFYCETCQEVVCPLCAALTHMDHFLIVKSRGPVRDEVAVNTSKSHVEELMKGLDDRSRKIQGMKADCDQLTENVSEIMVDHMHDIEQMRSRLHCNKEDLDKRIFSVRNKIEAEENKIYALKRNAEKELSLDDACDHENLDRLGHEIERCIKAQLPRERILSQLKVKVQNLRSNPSLATCVLRAEESTSLHSTTSVFQRLQPRSRSPSRERPSVGNKTQSSNPRRIPPSVPFKETCSTSPPPCSSVQMETSQMDQTASNEAAMEDEPEDDGEDMVGETATRQVTKCGARAGPRLLCPGNIPDILIHTLAKKILPENYTPLGLNLELEIVELKTAKVNHPHDFVAATFDILIQWRNQQCSNDIPVEDQIKKLVDALHTVHQSDVADWLKEEHLKFSTWDKSQEEILQPN